jgi:hypothetical protein
MRDMQGKYCAGAQVFLKNHFPVPGFLMISHRNGLSSPWLFIIADTRKYVMNGEIHP